MRTCIWRKIRAKSGSKRSLKANLPKTRSDIPKPQALLPRLPADSFEVSRVSGRSAVAAVRDKMLVILPPFTPMKLALHQKLAHLAPNLDQLRVDPILQRCQFFSRIGSLSLEKSRDSCLLLYLGTGSYCKAQGQSHSQNTVRTVIFTRFSFSM
jgi:hypothetical protein